MTLAHLFSTRTLRLLPLASALTLVACGGGGGGGSSPSAAAAIDITADNQNAVASDAAILNTGLAYIPNAVMNIGLPTQNNNAQRSLARSAAPTMDPKAGGQAIAALIKKFRAPASTDGARLAPAAATTETEQLACETGSGTQTTVYDQTETSTSGTQSYTRTIAATSCRIYLDGIGDVILNGTLRLADTRTYAEASQTQTTQTVNFDLAATNVTVRAVEQQGGLDTITIDGGFRVAGNGTSTENSESYSSTGSATLSGSRLALTVTGNMPMPAADVQQAQTYQLSFNDFSQVYDFRSNNDGYQASVNVTARIETNIVGLMTQPQLLDSVRSYQITTRIPVTLRYTDSGQGDQGLIAGEVRIAGADGTTITIIVTTPDTVRLERDDRGTGGAPEDIQTGLPAQQYLPNPQPQFDLGGA